MTKSIITALFIVGCSFFVPTTYAASIEYMVRENTTDSTTISDTETVFGWDSQTHASGTAVTYAANEFTLDTGKYLVMYTQEWETTDTSGNTRKQIQGRLQIDGVTATSGASACYIRKSNGDQSCVTAGNSIVDIAAATAALTTSFYKSDTEATGLPTREEVGQNGVQIIRLNENWNYGRYSLSTTQAATVSPTVFDDVVWDTSDEEDTGFSRSGADITIADAGRYIVSYSLPVTKGLGTGLAARTELTSRLTLDGVEVQGTRVSTYLRGAEGTHDGVLNYIGIVEVAAGDVLNVEEIKTDGNETVFYQGGTIEIVQLPPEAKTFIREATSGNQNPPTLTEFAWDTTAQIDTDTEADEPAAPEENEADSEAVVELIGDEEESDDPPEETSLSEVEEDPDVEVEGEPEVDTQSSE